MPAMMGCEVSIVTSSLSSALTLPICATTVSRALPCACLRRLRRFPPRCGPWATSLSPSFAASRPPATPSSPCISLHYFGSKPRGHHVPMVYSEGVFRGTVPEVERAMAHWPTAGHARGSLAVLIRMEIDQDAECGLSERQRTMPVTGERPVTGITGCADGCGKVEPAICDRRPCVTVAARILVAMHSVAVWAAQRTLHEQPPPLTAESFCPKERSARPETLRT